eukprot:1520879-Alexandrium_andersonii.AAC.1
MGRIPSPRLQWTSASSLRTAQMCQSPSWCLRLALPERSLRAQSCTRAACLKTRWIWLCPAS